MLFIIYVSLVAFSVVGSGASHLFKLDPGLIAPVAAFMLIVAGAGAVALAIGSWLRVALLLVISGGSELAGMLTGFPFGWYQYTDRWAPVVEVGNGHFFPILVPFAWLLIVGGAYLTVVRLQFWPRVALTALIATLIDMPMERAMTDVFEYWKWQPPGPVFGAPWQNSAGWFGVSFFVGLVLSGCPADRGSERGPWVLATFCAFVALVGSFTGYDWAWAVLGAYALLFAFLGQKSCKSETKTKSLA